MTTKELRLGNLVNHYGEIITVDGLDDIDIFNNKMGDIPIHSVQAIPLTDEWLEKFGFEKPAHSWNGSLFHLTEWDDFPLNWAVAMNKNGAMLVLKLKYVHQLQNIYFALTNEDLIIQNQTP